MSRWRYTRGAESFVVLIIALCGFHFIAGGTSTLARESGSEWRSHGLAVTFSLARRQYPEHALIRATLVVRNMSRHRAYIADGVAGLDAFVTDVTGTNVYDAANPVGTTPALLPTGGPQSFSYALLPGRSLSRRFYMVLNGNRTGYSLRLTNAGNTRQWTITGPWTSVGLTPAPAPHVTVVGGPHPRAVVTPPPGVRGTMFYTDQAACTFRMADSPQAGTAGSR